MTRSIQNAAGKSTSGWLDRLRKSKGIPTAPDVDFDHFITQLHNNAVPDPIPAPAPPAAAAPRSIHRAEIAGNDTRFNRISNVLAELFVMGGKVEIPGDDTPKSKSSQKQQKPRFCGPDISSSIGSNDLPTSSEGDSVKLVDNENEEEKSWSNLSGFSRTEVTVIDTSCSKWKFEKMLFRKNNLWRVRDKKGKGGFAKKEKKRKADDLLAVEDGGGGAKKSKEEDREDDKSYATSTQASATYGKPVKKKYAALNLEKGSSSVLIKNSTSIPRNMTSR